MKLGLEERVGRVIGASEQIVNFMPEYGAYLLNRLEVGVDGKTAYESCKGKKATVLGVEFCEKLLYNIKFKDKLAKLNARWEYGIFLVVRAKSGELWVSTRGGKVIKVRSVRRISPRGKGGVKIA